MVVERLERRSLIDARASGLERRPLIDARATGLARRVAALLGIGWAALASARRPARRPRLAAAV